MQCILNCRYCLLQRGAAGECSIYEYCLLLMSSVFRAYGKSTHSFGTPFECGSLLFQTFVLDPLLTMFVLLLQPVVFLERRVISTESRTIGEGSGSCSRPKNRHLLLGPKVR